MKWRCEMSVTMWLIWGAVALVLGMYWAWLLCGERWRRELERWVPWAVWVVVTGVSLASVLTHEPWRDELHTWLVTRDLSFGAMWHEMRFEGHVMLWQLVLHPFARAGCPPVTLGLVSWGINSATVFWLMLKGPFTPAEKVAVGLSCPFLYVQPVIARCYVLVTPVLFGLAALWERRKEYPLVFGGLTALLANTHLYLEGTAGVLFLVWVWEGWRKRLRGEAPGWRYWAGAGLMAAGMAVAVAQVLPTLWERSRGWGWSCGWVMDLLTFVLCGNSPLAWVALPVVMVTTGVLAWRADRGVAVVYGVGILFMVAFSVFLYSGNVINRAVLWFYLLLFAMWALAERIPGRWRVAVVLMTSLCLVRPELTLGDWRYEFDFMPKACAFVQKELGEEAEVFINGDDHPSSVAAAYLENLRDWRTGERTGRMSLEFRKWRPMGEFGKCREEIFAREPWRESFVAMGYPGTEVGLSVEDLRSEEVEVLYQSPPSVFANTGPLCVFRVHQRKESEKREERGE